jgi:hypothetical protein
VHAVTGSADDVVAAIEPGLAPPAVRARDAVLVTGPWLAGTSGVVAALRERMPERVFIEAAELSQTDAPAAVVFVVSAVAGLAESDCAIIDLATKHTDLVVGVVSKIDAHRNWRKVLAADRTALAHHVPRYEHVPWVGAAAKPDLGDSLIDELVALLRQRLADPELAHRNRLRAWESHLQALMDRYRGDGGGCDRRARVATLRKNRDDIIRGRRLARSERTIALRNQIQQARVQLGYLARNRCTSVRAELAEDASQLGRGRLRAFESKAHERAGSVVAEVEEGITEHLADAADQLSLPSPPVPSPLPPPEIALAPLKSRRLETQLMLILGGGFGLGVALMVTRLFAGLAPGLTVVGLVAGGLIGVVLTVWVVGIRGLLHDRAALERWVTEVTTTLRSALEERVATRVLAAEIALTSTEAARDEMEGAAAEDRVADIDAELREHAAQTARAALVRDRRLPSLERALAAVRTELLGPTSMTNRAEIAASGQANSPRHIDA